MPKDSAALCLIVEDCLFFIKRNDEVPTHKGQIAFVGGNFNDDESDSLTAVKREFLEETSIDAGNLEFITELELVYTQKSKKIFPWIAKCKLSKEEFIKKVKNNSEWEQFFLVPLSELCKKQFWQIASFHKDSMSHYVFFFPFIKDRYFSNLPINSTPILWGATARMVWSYINL